MDGAGHSPNDTYMLTVMGPEFVTLGWMVRAGAR